MPSTLPQRRPDWSEPHQLPARRPRHNAAQHSRSQRRNSRSKYANYLLETKDGRALRAFSVTRTRTSSSFAASMVRTFPSCGRRLPSLSPQGRVSCPKASSMASPTSSSGTFSPTSVFRSRSASNTWAYASPLQKNDRVAGAGLHNRVPRPVTWSFVNYQ